MLTFLPLKYRIFVAIARLAVGLVLHMFLIELAGAAWEVICAGQWLYCWHADAAQRRAGAAPQRTTGVARSGPAGGSADVGSGAGWHEQGRTAGSAGCSKRRAGPDRHPMLTGPRGAGGVGAPRAESAR